MIQINRKADSQYISWILLFGLAVGLSYLLYSWTMEQARESASQLEARSDPLICGEVGVTIKGSCQDFRSLELNVTNSNNQELAGIVIRMIGLYPDEDGSLETSTYYLRIGSGYTEKIRIMKKNTLSQVTIVPFARKENKYILCEEKSASKELSELKQC